jgi:hypothetical protein
VSAVVVAVFAALAVGCSAERQSPEVTGSSSSPASTGVIINQRELSTSELQAVLRAYGAAPPKGNYWYDARSGLYGSWGYEAAGYIRPGHDFGPLSPRASNGDTGAFLNGREINMREAMFFRSLFGVAYQGRFWLDGSTGHMGIEGDPTPRANLAAALAKALQGMSSSEYRWRDGTGAVISSSGNCTFAAIPGAPVYSTPGCG